MTASHRRSFQRNGLIVVTLAALIQCTGCGYPRVSDRTYEITNSLYSICNQRSEARLEIVEKLIEDSLANGKIVPREARWLEAIIDRARGGEWEGAALEARHMLEDQVEGY